VTRPFGAAPVGAIAGGLNGAISGARATYDWRRVGGVGAFVVDSTWSLVNTTAALALHGASALRGDPGYVDDLSRRRNRHVYARGFTLRRGFALSMGNVVTGAGEVDVSTTRGRRRRQLVDRHEGLHVTQARALGPLFPVLYGGWMLGGAVYGTALWVRHRDQPWFRLVEGAAYYRNPFEVAAYRRDGAWPPSRLHPLLGVTRRR
ncbi:MAG TPA: hypothetical protein VFZ83_15865, partial [Acidimicrobiia bacterium]|nr:hypothetical protein [Acidimicrobiia bacterium]